MSNLDPLLRMIAAQGGTTLKASGGEQPRLFHGENPLRFFAPPLGDGLLREMSRGSLGPATWAQVEAGERGEAEVDLGKAGRFQVLAQIEGGRIHLEMRRVMAAPSEPPAPSLPPRRSAARAQQAHAHSAETPRAEAPASPARAAPPAAQTTAQAAALPEEPSKEVVDLEALQPISTLLHRALHLGASDLHLGEDELPAVRVDGRLRDLQGELARPLGEILRESLDAALWQRLMQQGEVDFVVDLGAQGRVRAHAYRHGQGLALALRLLSRSAPSLESLQLGVDLDGLLDLSHGLILVVGPAGSGKSTTLAALARAVLWRRGGLLLTLEDPIEFVHEAPAHGRVRQRAIGQHVASFSAGLRAALRSDPQVLVVGEMRDTESIALALTAAETGHLVLSTLHSRDAASAVERLSDGVPPHRQPYVRNQIAGSLRAVISQRLLPKASGEGRLPVVELLHVTHAVAAQIREGRTAQIASQLQAGGELGMMSLARALSTRLRAGQIDRAAARGLLEELDER